MKTERDLFKRAYMNLRSSDHIPFPDAVFDEYVRLRDNEGFVLVPVEPTQKQVDAGIYAVDIVSNDKTQVVNVYKAMIEATK